MSNIKNIKRSVVNTVSAATAVVSVSTEVVADTSQYISEGIGATPAVLKALLVTPFSAAKGYIMESEGVSEEVATERAFKYLEQDVAVTIEETGTSLGKLTAQLFDDLEDDDDTANTKAAVNKS